MSNVNRDVATLAYGELRGFLRAFEALNAKTNHSYTFSFDAIPKTDDVSTAIQQRLEDCRVETRRIDDWVSETKRILERWLFAYQDPTGRLEDQHRTFALSHESSRRALVDTVMEMLKAIVTPLNAWRVEVQTKQFYECAWDDIAFEDERYVYFLHLGVSD